MKQRIEEEIKLVINPLKQEWDKKSELELELLLKSFGNICRSETSVYRNEVLSDNKLATVLLKIGEAYNKNSKMLIEIVSSINNMYSRYKLKITEDIFQFLIKQTNNKKVNFYVSIFITQLPQFDNYIDKWDYIMSIPDIAPKEKSINTFYRVISSELANIPDNLKSDIVQKFKYYLEKVTLHETTKDKYLDIIRKLK